VQHAFAKAADELIRYVRWQYLAQFIKRPAHHGRELVCRRMLCPAATQLQTSLPIRRCVHSPGLSPRPWPRRSGCRAGACTFPPILEAWGLERIGKAHRRQNRSAARGYCTLCQWANATRGAVGLPATSIEVPRSLDERVAANDLGGSQPHCNRLALSEYEPLVSLLCRNRTRRK
jgi:hypothetical protein